MTAGQAPGTNGVARVGAVLRAVASAEPDGASTTELAKLAGLARPTAHRMLVSLAEEHLVAIVAYGRRVPMATSCALTRVVAYSAPNGKPDAT